MFFVFFSLTYTKGHLGRPTLIKKMLHQNSLEGTCAGIFLINEWCGRAQPTVGGATSGQGVLGGIRQQTEPAREAEFPMVFGSVPCGEFRP